MPSWMVACSRRCVLTRSILRSTAALVRTVTIARGTLRACAIPKGAMVLAAKHSAMFDPTAVDAPNRFRADRSGENYLLWGHGLQSCAGATITVLCCRPC